MALQPICIVRPENISSVLQFYEWQNAKDGKAIVDDKPDVDYKPTGPIPGNEAVAQEEEEDSNAGYVKMELLCQGK